MSKIASQTIKGSIYSYLGIIIGFLSVTILRSHVLTIEQVGVLEVITSYTMILAQLGSLGFLNAGIRCFPFFRDPEKNHNGFMFLLLAVPIVGTLFFISLYFLLQYILPENNYFDFLQEYSIIILAFTIITLLFNIFDTYNRTALYNAVTGSMLKEFLQKLTVAMAMGLMLFVTLPFQWFLVVWLAANAIPTIIIILKLKQENAFNFKPNFKFLDAEKRKMLTSVSLFAVISGFTTMVIQYIDRIMIDGMINTSLTGIYGTAALFGVIVIMPSRIMYRIGGIIVAEKWKENDLAGINSVYKKSCINQLLIGLLIFIGIWANIDNVFKLLPEGYEAGKYVILFISLGGLIEMSTGLNGVILATSKYYKYDTYFFLALIGLTIGANFYFIPAYGITGAAVASALTTFFFNLFRYLFIWRKFNIQPFGLNNFYILCVGTIILFLISYLPTIKWFPVDIIVRSGIITIAYVGILYVLKLSAEMNKVIDNLIDKAKLLIK
jgi:O-antigen/teichoic acid export membrane protein